MPLRYLVVSLLLLGPVITLAMPGCAVCKSTDSAEICRTKQRDHNQPRIQGAAGFFERRG